MHDWIALDGRIEPAPEARLPLTAAGVLCGSGVFTTLRWVGGAPFLWEAHAERLRAGAHALGFAASDVPGPDELGEALVRLVEANGGGDALVRVTLLEGEGELWLTPGADRRRVHSLILAKPLGPAAPRRRVGISGWPVFSKAHLKGHKLLSYTEPWLSLRDAARQGFDEAVRLNERGEIAGGCRCALLWLRGGRVCAPGPGSGAVRSTTQAWAERHLESVGRGISPATYTLADLLEAQELLLLSAGIGVQGAESLMERHLPGPQGELARELSDAFQRAATNTV